MPLVTKASRKGKKPGWQRGVVAPNREQRDAQIIVANHEKKFTRAFNWLLSNLLSPKMLRTVLVAIREESSIDAMLKRIPYFDPEAPETVDIWAKFAKRMETTYQSVIDEAVNNENRKRGWKVEVRKIEQPEIPINPSVLEFIELKALTRVVDISDKDRERVREILTRGMETNATASSMMEEIEDTIGLTDKQVIRLNRKLDKAKAEGMGAKLIRALRKTESSKIRKQRAAAISRTETTEALSVGLQESWRQAEDDGVMPQGAEKEWASMPYDPDRSSEVCRNLDGQRVGINQNFDDPLLLEPVPGPPAHPN